MNKVFASDSANSQDQPHSNPRRKWLEPRWLIAHHWEIAILLLVLCSALFIRGYAEASNLRNLMAQSAPILLLAIGQTFVLLVRGIDLTQGAMAGLSSVMLVVLLNVIGPIGAIVAVLLFASALGFANGWLIARSRIDPLVATLAGMYIIFGITMFWTGGTPVTRVNPTAAAFLEVLGNGSIGFVPVSFGTAVLLALGAYFFLHRLMIGLRLYAIGSNPKAAASLGIQRNLVFGVAYAASGVFTVIAALLLTSRIRQGNPHLGEGLLFESIGAAVLGGVSLAGGIGGVWAAARGVAMLALIQNALYLTDLNSHVRDVAVGIMILAGILLARRSRPGDV
ncbi:MAG: ABC transporter permease [Phycisphaerae bacterium]